MLVYRHFPIPISNKSTSTAVPLYYNKHLDNKPFRDNQLSFAAIIFDADAYYLSLFRVIYKLDLIYNAVYNGLPLSGARL